MFTPNVVHLKDRSPQRMSTPKIVHLNHSLQKLFTAKIINPQNRPAENKLSRKPGNRTDRVLERSSTQRSSTSKIVHPKDRSPQGSLICFADRSQPETVRSLVFIPRAFPSRSFYFRSVHHPYHSSSGPIASDPSEPFA